MAIKTKQEKAKALKALAERKARGAKTKQIDNSALHAGSPMYYYCRLCRLLAAKLHEEHTEPVPPHCTECQKLVDAGWSEKEQAFI